MLQELKHCSNLSDLAALLGFKPQNIAYILYKIDEDDKYKVFNIPKKAGGERSISSPNEKLKLLQRRLAYVLYICSEEIYHPSEIHHKKDGENTTKSRIKKSVSHGYEKGLSIATNAYRHQRKKYVYNADLKDFFPSINFGRVRGYFIKDKHFKLNSDVATIIAQIACHKNQLPQGSPCSPIISNLIARKLDYKITLLAKKHKFDYSRYVDDITISTNLLDISPEAIERTNDSWVLGRELKSVIVNSGFVINERKGRMQYSHSRQEVTGVVVNRHINVSSDYYRAVRAIFHRLSNKGTFHLNGDSNEYGIKDINKIHGAINHIYTIKSFKNKFANEGRRSSRHDGIRTGKDGGKSTSSVPLNRCQDYSNESHVVAIDGIKNLYNKFLFYKYFVALDKPLIICEGKTDNTYLKCAISILKDNTSPIKNTDGKTVINFFNRTKTNSEILKMAEGTSGLEYIVDIYNRYLSKFNHSPLEHPVIMIADNDPAGRGLLQKARKVFKHDITDGRAFKNLYIILSSDIEKNECIEDLFSEKLLTTPLNGKAFNYKSNEIDITREYGKEYFSVNIVKKETDPKAFERFPQLLDRIENIVKHYKKI